MTIEEAAAKMEDDVFCYADRTVKNKVLEFLSETDPDVYPTAAAEFARDVAEDDPLELVARFYHGHDFGENSPANPHRDYFAYNGYANIVSIRSEDLEAYLQGNVSAGDFLGWLQAEDDKAFREILDIIESV